MKPQNPYKDCEQYSRMQGWDEGYDACARQRISKQEGWQTDEPETDEGPFLLELEDCVTGELKYRTADYYVPPKIDSDGVFRSNEYYFHTTPRRWVKRWKRI